MRLRPEERVNSYGVDIVIRLIIATVMTIFRAERSLIRSSQMRFFLLFSVNGNFSTGNVTVSLFSGGSQWRISSSRRIERSFFFIFSVLVKITRM